MFQACVGLEKVPEGDWLCPDCATPDSSTAKVPSTPHTKHTTKKKRKRLPSVDLDMDTTSDEDEDGQGDDDADDDEDSDFEMAADDDE